MWIAQSEARVSISRRAALCAIRLLHPQKYPPAWREPTCLCVPGIFPSEGRYPDQFLPFLLQVKSEMEGLLQVFVHQHEIRAALGIFKFTEEKAAGCGMPQA